MSRWINDFETHQFHQELEEYKDEINGFDKNLLTNPDIIIEFVRLTKAIIYIEGLVKLVDPELNSPSALNNVHVQLRNSLNQFRKFQSNHNNLGIIQQTNNQIDSCLNVLKPMQTVLPTTPKKSLVSMLGAYDKGIQKILASTDLELVKKNVDDIERYKERLLGEDDSVKSNINGMLADIEEKQRKVLEVHAELFEDSETHKAIKKQIDDAHEHIADVESSTIEIQKKYKHLIRFYDKIFGKKDNVGTGARFGGLNEELSNRLKSLQKWKKTIKRNTLLLLNKLKAYSPMLLAQAWRKLSKMNGTNLKSP